MSGRRHTEAVTPEQAAEFCEEDEDPDAVFAWFDAGPHGLTKRPDHPASEKSRDP
jgi:hypothetical protein